jgi:CHASE1-domain containing sensor protein
MLVALLTSVALAKDKSDEMARAEAARQQGQATEIMKHLHEGFDRYEQALNAQKAFLASSNNAVSPAAFDTFVHQLGLNENYRGLQGMGFVQVVPRTQKAAFVSRMRSEGHRDYRVSPLGDRSEYFLMRHQQATQVSPASTSPSIPRSPRSSGWPETPASRR